MNTAARKREILIGVVGLAVAFSVIGYFVYMLKYGGRPETPELFLLSPNGRHKVRIRDTYPNHNIVNIDNNFTVSLIDVETGNETSVFNSPDEGMPPGTMRVIWSEDSTKFIVVGRHLFVDPEIRLANGDIVYLEYQIASEVVTCNASQSTCDRVDTTPTNMRPYGLSLEKSKVPPAE